MRTDELRTTLHEHADEAHDLAATDRIAAVRGRVRTVRRRRQGGLAAVVVAAVATVGLSVVPLDGERDVSPAGPEEAPARLAGQEVPATQTSLGYTYEYARGVESDAGDRRLELKLPASDERRLIGWASSSDDPQAQVRVTVDQEPVSVSSAGRYEGFEEVEPGYPLTVVVEQPQHDADDLLGIAVFTASAEPPPGVSNGDVTFRDEILGERLLGGAIGEPGQNEVTFEVDAGETPLRFSHLCYGAGLVYDVNVSLDGRFVFGSGCNERAPFDPGEGGTTFTDGVSALRDQGIEPGDTVTVRVWLSEAHQKGRPAQDPAVVIGGAVYEDRSTESSSAVGPIDVPQRLQHGGRLWELVNLYQSDPGGDRAVMQVDDATEPLLVATGHGDVAAGYRVRLVVDGETLGTTTSNVRGLGTFGADRVLLPGRSHTVAQRVLRGLTPRTRLVIATYTRVD